MQIDLDPSDYSRPGRPRLVRRSTMWWGFSVCTLIGVVLFVGEVFSVSRADMSAITGIAFCAFIAGSCLSFLFPRFFFTRLDSDRDH